MKKSDFLSDVVFIVTVSKRRFQNYFFQMAIFWEKPRVMITFFPAPCKGLQAHHCPTQPMNGDNNANAVLVSQVDANGGKETSPGGTSDTLHHSEVLDYSPAASPSVNTPVEAERSHSLRSVTEFSSKTEYFSTGNGAKEAPPQLPRSVESGSRSSRSTSRRVSESSHDTVSSVPSSTCLRASKRSRKRVDSCPDSDQEPAADMQQENGTHSVEVEQIESASNADQVDQAVGSAVNEVGSNGIHTPPHTFRPADATPARDDDARTSEPCELNLDDRAHPSKSAEPPDAFRLSLRMAD